MLRLPRRRLPQPILMSDGHGVWLARELAGHRREGLALVEVAQVLEASAACPELTAGDRLLVPVAELDVPTVAADLPLASAAVQAANSAA